MEIPQYESNITSTNTTINEHLLANDWEFILPLSGTVTGLVSYIAVYYFISH